MSDSKKPHLKSEPDTLFDLQKRNVGIQIRRSSGHGNIQLRGLESAFQTKGFSSFECKILRFHIWIIQVMRIIAPISIYLLAYSAMHQIFGQPKNSRPWQEILLTLLIWLPAAYLLDLLAWFLKKTLNALLD